MAYSKAKEKDRAIQLRRQGKTYSEILREISVAKSTLSLWLRSVGLATEQKQRLTKRKLEAAMRGAIARRTHRLQQVQDLVEVGLSDVGRLSDRELWLIGVALYWAEGSKQKSNNPSTGIMLGNSDPNMLKVFLMWLRQLGIPDDAICFELYVHDDRKAEAKKFLLWWSDVLNIKSSRIGNIYFKRGNPKTNRTNVDSLYHGLIRIKVRLSTVLNRKVNGWIAGIVASLGSGVTGNTSAFEAEDSRFDT